MSSWQTMVGSYLHIRSNVSHYVKLVCDEIFGDPMHSRNEIVWQRTLSKSLMTTRLAE